LEIVSRDKRLFHSHHLSTVSFKLFNKGKDTFMDGWVAGANYYAEKKGAEVKVLGWDPVKAEGQFNPNTAAPFNDIVWGKSVAEGFMGQGADVVHAVAGTTGNGSYQAMLDAKKYSVGVDLDQCITLSM
jgi:basic membrane protein A